MTTSHQERIVITSIAAVALFGSAAALMVVGLLDLTDDTGFERGFEVFSEIAIAAGPVLGYWFAKSRA